MSETAWLEGTSPAFRLMIATSWLAPASWQQNQELAIRKAIAANPDWTEYIRLVDRHRIPAMSCAALKRVPALSIPDAVWTELQKRSDACRMQAIRHSMILAEVLKAFNRGAIPVMPLKGPILSFDLYGDVGLRQSQDLDIAVAIEDIQRAQACLEGLGWRVDSGFIPVSPRQWKSFLKQEHHIGFIHPRGNCILELHWCSRGLESSGLTKSRWERCVPSIWQGCVYQSLNPIDCVLDLCSHGGDHSWLRAKWLGDLARIQADGRMDWEMTLKQAVSSSQDRTLLAGLCLSNRLYGLPLPSLSRDPWKVLSPILIDRPITFLTNMDETTDPNVMAIWPRLSSHFRYNRMAHPEKTWHRTLAELAYCREDFRVFRLPDSLFWAYAPLRPILWFWRRILYRRSAEKPDTGIPSPNS